MLGGEPLRYGDRCSSRGAISRVARVEHITKTVSPARLGRIRFGHTFAVPVHGIHGRIVHNNIIVVYVQPTYHDAYILITERVNRFITEYITIVDRTDGEYLLCYIYIYIWIG